MFLLIGVCNLKCLEALKSLLSCPSPPCFPGVWAAVWAHTWEKSPGLLVQTHVLPGCSVHWIRGHGGTLGNVGEIQRGNLETGRCLTFQEIRFHSATFQKKKFGGSDGKESTLAMQIPWRREWQPTPVFLPEESHGQRSLTGYSPWSCKELDMTEWLSHKQMFNGQSGGKSWALAASMGSVGMHRPSWTPVLHNTRQWFIGRHFHSFIFSHVHTIHGPLGGKFLSI